MNQGEVESYSLLYGSNASDSGLLVNGMEVTYKTSLEGGSTSRTLVLYTTMGQNLSIDAPNFFITH